MCRYPASSAAATADVVSSGGLWKTPRPRAGISMSLLSFRAGVVAGVILGPLVPGDVGARAGGTEAPGGARARGLGRAGALRSNRVWPPSWPAGQAPARTP